MATFLLYLNEWDEGGETVFLLEGKNGLERLRNIDYKACDTGLAVKPARTGDALLFWSIQPGGGFDKRALHGGCPVRNGTKARALAAPCAGAAHSSSPPPLAAPPLSPSVPLASQWSMTKWIRDKSFGPHK